MPFLPLSFFFNLISVMDGNLEILYLAELWGFASRGQIALFRSLLVSYPLVSSGSTAQSQPLAEFFVHTLTLPMIWLLLHFAVIHHPDAVMEDADVLQIEGQLQVTMVDWHLLHLFRWVTLHLSARTRKVMSNVIFMDEFWAKNRVLDEIFWRWWLHPCWRDLEKKGY